MKTLLLFLAGLLLVTACLEFFRPFERLLTLCLIFALIPSVIVGGLWLSIFLENRFPQIAQLPADVKGIILLGGSFNTKLTAERGMTCYNRRAGRVFAFLELAQQYPKLRFIFSGAGVSKDMQKNESVIARKLFINLGLDQNRITYEDKSRNTYENAILSYEVAKPKENELWVLVTSAFHMPRAVGLFRKAGWKVLPYPCDYAAPTHYSWGWNLELATLLRLSFRGYHEVLGMACNYMKGASDTFLP